MRKIALLLTLLVSFVQGAMATVTITYSGDTCTLPANIQFTADVTGIPGLLTYNWNFGVFGPTGTGANPSVTFTSPGTYLVTLNVADMMGNVYSGSTSVTITDACTNYITFTGHLYEDQNGNCAYDAGEPGHSGLQVSCLGTNNGSQGSTYSDANGFYSMTVPYDTGFGLSVNDGPLFTPTCIVPAVVGITSPTIDNVHDFALAPVPMATLSGYMYSDQNGNCQYDATEYGYASRVVNIHSAGGMIFTSATTDVNGHYSVSLPADTSYTVYLNNILGQNAICPASGTTTITVLAGGSTQDFAITMLPMTMVSGHVYTDADNSCSYDAGETGFPGRPVHFQSNGGSISTATYTDANGYYHTMLPYDSTYTLTVSPAYNLGVSCPASGTASLNLTSAPATQDFALNCIPATDPWNLAVDGWVNTYNFQALRPFGVHLINTQGTCMDEGAVVKLSLHPALQIQIIPGSGWVADSVVGQDVYWHVDAGTVISSLYTGLMVLADSDQVALGDTLCSTITIIHNGPGDAIAADDTATICGVVTGSYDPNDKAVSPQGAGPQGYLPSTPQTLSYLIRFQNTGTDTAYNIVVRDTLSANVDWSTLKVLNASHPINMSQGAGGAVAFNFPNILLPDSNVNEAASHGFVAYSVKMQDSLAPGTPIANTAYIYFDNNAAVVTNTTLNTIELQAPTGVQSVRSASANIFPNPANEWLHIASQEYQSAVLTDASGRTLRTASGQGNLRMNVQDLPEGMYWLKLSGTKGMVVKKVTVAH